MPRTRSSIARAAPKPHKLPTDILTRVAAFARDDDLARLALTAKSALTALDNQQIWAATLRTNHGGLRVDTSRESGLRAAKCLAEARKNRGPVYGCHALASDVTSYGGRPVWVDGMFQPEPWRVYYSAMGNERVLCAATFLTGGTYDPDRQWMIDVLLELCERYNLQRDFSQWIGTVPDTAAALFHSILSPGDARNYYSSFVPGELLGRMDRKFAELRGRVEAGASWSRTGLDATAFEERDGVTVDTRVEALCGGVRQATVVATALVVRRPSRFASRPGRVFLVYGCRRPPRVTDLSDDGRLKRLSMDARVYCGGLITSCTDVRRVLCQHVMSALGCTEVRSLRDDRPAYQLLGSDEEIFPLAICGFKHDLDRDVTDLRVELSKPVAIQGLVVAILEVDNEDPNLGVNVDMEYVGVEGYTYE